MSRRLFGTDGIRAVAGQGPLAGPELVRLGRALAAAVGEGGPLHRRVREEASRGGARARRVVIGRDTRPSGPAIRDAIGAGLRAAGVEAIDLGVLPTPAVALVMDARDADLGIVISASHNPPADNGVKLFVRGGRKASPELEAWLEERVAALAPEPPPADAAGAVARDEAAADRYVERLLAACAGLDLAGRTIAFDGANGAAAVVGPRVLEALGARVVRVGCEADGARINDRCGATHPEAVHAAAREAELGISVDGDADRVLLVDEDGAIRDGDDILWALATDRWGERAPAGATVVSTVMANFGLELALGRLGVALVRTDVGDRNVSLAMEEHGAPFGAEPSGHVIVAEHAPTGDGLHTALRVLAAAVRRGQTLARLCSGFGKSPQSMVNVMVRDRPPLESLAAVQGCIRAANDVLAGAGGGRVLVRYSGTEPKARVLVEGAHAQTVGAQAELIADALRAEIGEARAPQ